MTDLLRGGIAPGTRLRQDELAARLGVSKIPVREALQRLTAIGLLQFESNRGAVTPRLCAADAEENFALRRSIEPLLLDRALPGLTLVDLAEAEMVLADKDLSITEANWAFHRSLYRASGWDRGLGMAEVLHAAVAPYVTLYTEGLGGSEQSVNDHSEILAACRQGNRELAGALLIRHLDDAALALQGFFETTMSRPFTDI